MEKKPALSAAVLEALNEDNYLDWSVQLKTYLMAQDLWEIVESTSEPPARENEAAFKAWNKTNAMALHVIQMSCGPDTFSDIREISSARGAWDSLAKMYSGTSFSLSFSILSFVVYSPFGYNLFLSKLKTKNNVAK